jgi:hypothetical protein
MSPELAHKRQRWYDTVLPGTLVRYNEWATGYVNKPALIISVHDITVPVAGPYRRNITQKQYIILVDENKRLVHQDLISPLDGWSNLL